MTSSVTIKYNTNYKNISSRKSYISSQFMKTINIENENFFRLQSNNIKLDLSVYNFIKSLKMDFLIFREAYFNQRKKYKLLRAHIDLINKFIDEDEYDKIKGIEISIKSSDKVRENDITKVKESGRHNAQRLSLSKFTFAELIKEERDIINSSNYKELKEIKIKIESKINNNTFIEF